MDRTEAERIVSADRERNGGMVSDEIVEKLSGIFTKDISEYTREDFVEGTEPYEYLYLYIDDSFVMEQKQIKIDAVAKKCGVRNFTTLFKNYCKNKGKEIGGLNVTDFPMQPLTLRCGNYVCDISGVKSD
ncbi:MAG: hypothetical protein K2J79_08875, partial [Ruminiclostridium sp.]|nr:hypothetical protein [Ruminiclostridium sp.]